MSFLVHWKYFQESHRAQFPLLFLVYVNDNAEMVKPPVKLKLFADDCLIYAPIANGDDQLKINQCLQALHMRCQTWGMEINYLNSTIIHISKKKKIITFEYHIGNLALLTVDAFKYLGVIIMHKL